MAINFPVNPVLGQTYSYGDYTYTYDGVKWTSVVKYGSSAVKIQSSTPPPSPEVGLQWYDDVSGRTYFWHVNTSDGIGQWVEDAPQGVSDNGVGQNPSIVYVQEEMPTGPSIPSGAQWYKPSETESYIYYVDPQGNKQWIEEDSVGDDGGSSFNFTQEDAPTERLFFGARWFKPSTSQEFIYYVGPNEVGVWTEANDTGDSASAIGIETSNGSTVQEFINSNKLNSLLELKSLDTSKYENGDKVSIIKTGRIGDFIWDSSDLSSEVSLDEVTNGEGDGGFYIAPSSDKTGASGAWVRNETNTISTTYYGAEPNTICASSINAAIRAAKRFGIKNVFTPAGVYFYDDEIYIDDTIKFIGMGKRTTYFKPVNGYSGWFMQLYETTFVGTGNQGPIIDASADTSSIYLADFCVASEQLITETQHGIRFVGRCDRVKMESVYFEMLKGTNLYLGFQNSVPTNPAYARECTFIDVETRGGGDPSVGAPAWVIDSYGSGDATNLNSFYSCRVIFPYGIGLDIRNNATNNRVRRCNFYNLLLHAGVSTNSADMMRIRGAVSNIKVVGYEANSTVSGQIATVIDTYNGEEPFSITIDGNITSGDGDGFDVRYGRKIRIVMDSLGSTGMDLRTGAGINGSIQFDTIGETSPTLDLDPTTERFVSCFESLIDDLPMRLSKIVLGNSFTSPNISQGSGSPEGVVSSPAGSLYLNRGTNTDRNCDAAFVKTSGSGSTLYRALQELVGGTTAQRPSSPSLYQSYFDTTLGYSVSWDGTNWKDGSGNIV